MLTNPNTLGLFERTSRGSRAIVTRVGGLVYYDGANLNAIMGRARPGDMGFDIVHINTHKTFATPARRGRAGRRPGRRGRGARAVPARSPRVERDGDGAFRVDHDRPDSIGRVHGFHGNVGILVRAYAYVFAARARRAARGGRAGGAERELPRGARARRVPARVPGQPPDARVRRDGQAARTRARRPRDGRREAGDRPRVPPVDRVLPARGRGGDDGRADRDRVEGDPGRLRRGAAPGGAGGREPTRTSCTRPRVTTPVGGSTRPGPPGI